MKFKNLWKLNIAGFYGWINLLFFVQSFLFKDKIEQIIKVTEKVVPKMITGVNNIALVSIKNFCGPADNKHISPTMMEDI